MKNIILLILLLSPGVTANSPIIFSHNIHVTDQGFKCTKCHSPKLLKSSMSSSDVILPTEKRCMKCHRKWRETEQCEKCHLGTKPFKTFSAVQRVFEFAHKIHYHDQKIDCKNCHGNMAGVENNPPIPKMKDCLQCHKDNKGPEYCSACHTNVAKLRPADHGTQWLTQHDVAALSETSDCKLCHTQLSCDNCHSGAVLSTDELPLLNPVPGYRTDDFSGKQMLVRNHDLNYVNTHGLDAVTKERDCRVCHEAAEFCTDCHQNSTDMILNKPNFHGGVNWGAIKYPDGTDFVEIIGGGVHADMARIDIETCQSCHDIDGGDPLCVDCHNDRDGVQNTDPKTHSAGYLHNTQGDWCTEPVSMCFVCHTPQTKGVGFCGYCHP